MTNKLSPRRTAARLPRRPPPLFHAVATIAKMVQRPARPARVAGWGGANGDDPYFLSKDQVGIIEQATVYEGNQ